MVQSNAAKINGIYSGEEEKALQPYFKIVSGLALLGMEDYCEAARSFLNTDASVPFGSYNEIASPNDVAVYGGLLALASMDRKGLQAHVLDNANFRTFLELEPHIRRAITMFVNGRYSACLGVLESYRPDYLLDIYLQPHLGALYSRIRNKCIVQYFIPFSCVTLNTMSREFAIPGQSIEEELASMIRSGVLQARLNTIDKLLTDVSVDPRAEMQALGLQTVKEYEKQALERIRRMNLISADLEVKGPRKGGPLGMPNLHNIAEKWTADARSHLMPSVET